MMPRPCTMWLACLAMAWSFSARAQTAQDLQDAMAAGQAALPALTTAAGAKNVVPDYTETPKEVNLATTDLASQARARIAACAAQPSAPGCDATLAVQEVANAPRANLSDMADSVQGAEAIGKNPAGTLGNLSSLYSGCSQTGQCSNDVFCFGSHCFDTKAVNDTDFAMAMTYMEGARQAGVYLDPGKAMNASSVRIFGGESARCQEGLLIDCCKPRGEANRMSNALMTGVGSKLVFDLLMNSGNRRFIMQGLTSLVTGAGFSGTISSFGVTFTVNPQIVDPMMTTVHQVDGVTVAFDPTTLAITVAVLVVMEMKKCDPEELKTGLKEGAHLCHTVEAGRCAKRILGFCVRRETVKCCFNSVLARVINEQGRKQLGKDWGSGDRPACDGFSVPELERLDFSTMDLTEFYASIVPDNPDNNTFAQGAQAIAPECYHGKGKCNATQSIPAGGPGTVPVTPTRPSPGPGGTGVGAVGQR